MRVRCPECDRRINCHPEDVGERVRCPHCDHRFRLPAQDDDDLGEGRGSPRRQASGSTGPSAGVAALLEVGPGVFQVFGLGHMYSGSIGMGLLFLFGYWILQTINAVLGFLFCGIGLFTVPMLWLLTMILAPLSAANGCRRH